MEKNMIKICELLINVISEFYEKDSQARNFGTDVELYHSEIHMLQCIEENPGMHISGIARMMGVTRGAASQTAKRLERKEMIVKEACLGNDRKVVLRLTEKGKVASYNHKNAHEEFTALISKILTEAREEQLEFLHHFLLRFQASLKGG
ncbi:MarR family winged helix-turn-helix transcriptional regulator [Alkaliphilus crotonatoxidans]